MKDNWINHNTDKLLLFILTCLLGAMILHILHHGSADGPLLAWAENSFSTVLGALILILTGRINRAAAEAPPSLTAAPSAPDVPPAPSGSAL